METKKKFVVSHAPYWHDGGRLSARSANVMLAALPAIAFGVHTYGASAVGVLALAMASAMAWELLMNLAMKRRISIGDGNAAVIGMILAMLLPASAPWWMVVVGTFAAVVIGKQIYGGMGGNPFNPVLIGLAILTLSWPLLLDFEAALVNYSLPFDPMYPLSVLKRGGPSAVDGFKAMDLFLGGQMSGIGSGCGLALVLGGVWLIIRGAIRWEVSLSFIVGVAVTAFLFAQFGEEGKYASAAFHLVSGYTLIGAFFLATEDSSSPVNFAPMLIFGAGCGIMTVLIRNLGVQTDGVVFGILLMNVVHPLLDMIRPRALGKVVENA